MQDHELVIAAQRGDNAAFASLIQRHQQAVYAFLRARLLEPADAEDLTQEVFLRCYTARAKFDSPHMVRPWLYGIARNLLREHIRRYQRRKEVAWTELCLDLETRVGEDLGIMDDYTQHLPECLDGLGPSARDALNLYYRQHKRLLEIGNLLRRSEGAVKLLMFRARQALKMCLSGKLKSDQQ
ncbi:MAG: RNA polymerase sigma factor [Pirellulales bacterium]|nr:RNA polymerase sigma factor [Pirellulales bacterium]